MVTSTYPWLTIGEDGSVRADLQGCTSAEMDRRLVIMQEIEAGRVVVADKVRPLLVCLGAVASYTYEENALVNRIAHQAEAALSRYSINGKEIPS